MTINTLTESMADSKFSSLKFDMQYSSKWHVVDPMAVLSPPVLFILLTKRILVLLAILGALNHF